MKKTILVSTLILNIILIGCTQSLTQAEQYCLSEGGEIQIETRDNKEIVE